MSNHQYDIKIFATAQGDEPFVDWLEGFNRDVKKRIISRINRVSIGNLGDKKTQKEDIKKAKQYWSEYKNNR